VNRARVLLADDHAVLRAGLRLLVDAQPDMTVIAEAGDGPEAVRKARQHRPDVAVFDLSMPRTEPAATIGQLFKLGVRTLVLTMHDDAAYMDAALAAGARGYVLKKAADVELLGAIRSVVRGGLHMGVRAADTGTGALERRGPVAVLSARERQVLRLIGYGFTNREIGGQLGLSVKTVETFRARICNKLGLHSRADLVSCALRMGLVAPAPASGQE
jgi:two-component system response regulator NreC